MSYNTGTGIQNQDPLYIPSLSGENRLLIATSDGQISTTALSADTLITLNENLSDFSFSDYALQSDLISLSNQINSIQGADLSSYVLKTTYNTTSNNLATLSNLYAITSNVVSGLSNANLGFTKTSDFIGVSNLSIQNSNNFSNYTTNTSFVQLSNNLSNYTTLTNFYTLSNVVSGLSNADLSGFTKTLDFIGVSNLSIQNSNNFSNYTLKTDFVQLSNNLSNITIDTSSLTPLSKFNTLSNLYTATSNYVSTIISGGEVPDLSGYATVSSLNTLSNNVATTFSSYATTSSVNTLSNIVTTSLTTLSNNVATTFSSYATVSSVNTLSNNVNTSLTTLCNNLSTTLTGYALNTSLNNYTLTSLFTPLSNTVISNTSQITTNTTAISTIDTSLANYALTSSLSSYTPLSSYNSLNTLYIATSNCVSSHTVSIASNTTAISTINTSLANYALISSLSSYTPLSSYNSLNTLYLATSNVVATNSASISTLNTNILTYTPLTSYNSLNTLYLATSNLVSSHTSSIATNTSAISTNTTNLSTLSDLYTSTSNYVNTLSAGGSSPTISQFNTLSNQEVVDRSNISTIAGFVNSYTSSYLATSNQLVIDESNILINAGNITALNVLYLNTSNLVNSNTTNIANRVIAPATNTASYIPQWNGANSKTLSDGINSATLATLTGTQTLTNKTIDYSLNTILNLPSGTSGDGFTLTSVKTAAYTANAWEEVLVAATGAAATYTITLPASPTVGQAVRVTMTAGNTTYIVKIARNASPFNGSTTAGVEDSYALVQNGESVTLKYENSTIGWAVVYSSYKAIAARLYQSAVQSFAANTLTVATMNTVDYDTAGGVADGTNKWFLIRRSGKYLFSGQIFYSSIAASKVKEAFVWGTTYYQQMSLPTTGGGEDVAPCTITITPAVGDNVQLKGRHSDTVSRNTFNGTNYTFMTLTEIR